MMDVISFENWLRVLAFAKDPQREDWFTPSCPGRDTGFGSMKRQWYQCYVCGAEFTDYAAHRDSHEQLIAQFRTRNLRPLDSVMRRTVAMLQMRYGASEILNDVIVMIEDWVCVPRLYARLLSSHSSTISGAFIADAVHRLYHDPDFGAALEAADAVEALFTIIKQQAAPE